VTHPDAVVATTTPGRRSPGWRFDSVAFLSCFLVLLVGVPSILVLAPLGASGTPAAILGLVALLWWFVARLTPGLGVARGAQPVRIVVLAFLLSVLVSYLAAAMLPLAGIERSGADRGMLTILSAVGIAVLAADGIDSYDRLERLLSRIVNAGVFLGLVGILQFFTRFDISTLFKYFVGLTPNAQVPFFYDTGAVPRVAGTATHPIEFGVTLAFALPFALHFAFAAPPARRLRQSAKLGVISTALPMSLSRSAALGAMAVILMMFLAWSWSRRRVMLLALPAFLIALRIAVPGLLGSVYSLFINLGTDNSIKHRTQDYALVGKFIWAHPYLGRGFGTFIPSRYFLLDNQYLGTIIELGFVGLTALIVMLVVAFFTARGARRRTADADRRDLSQALAASIAVAIVSFGTFDALGFPMVTGMLFLLMGCAGAMWRLNDDGVSQSSGVEKQTAPLSGVRTDGFPHVSERDRSDSPRKRLRSRAGKESRPHPRHPPRR
jgi:O-antigen ligase